jgi:anti-sigma regulatory factor (Ser/Thr protein kinase)
MRGSSGFRLADGDHVVHLYDGEDRLSDLVGSYLTASLLVGETVISIAIPPHQSAFESAMSSGGVDTGLARSEGRLLMLDAEEALARFMVEGLPDPERFDRAVGDLIRDACRAGRPVRAFGEMVAVLWGRGQVAGAIELERLWNGLANEVPFGLFCAYPLASVETATGGIRDVVCRAHSHVVGEAPELSMAEEWRRFVASRASVKSARRFVAETLARWGHGSGDDSVSVVSELAANAVEHAGGDFTVGLARSPKGVRLSVGDSTRALPVRRGELRLSENGRGLLLVERLAHEWGCEMVGDGKVVWADLARRGG